MSIAVSIIVMLVMLSILTIVHEWGHFIAARIFKVKVTEFSIFMGPCIWSRTSKKSGTKYSIRALPIGGYCAFEDDQGNADAPDSLNSQKWYKRFVIFIAGVALNIVLALIITIIMLFCTGYETTTLSSVPENSPMAIVGIKEGDVLSELNGHSIITPTDYNIYSIPIVDTNPAEDIMDSHYTMTYERADGSELFCDISKHAVYEIETDEEGNKIVSGLLLYEYTIVTEEENLPKKTYELKYSTFETPEPGEPFICEFTKTINGGIPSTEILSIPYAEYGRAGGTNFTHVDTYNPLKVIWNSGKTLISMVRSIYTSLFWLIDGTVGLEAVAGPVGLTTVVDDVVGASASVWLKVLTLLNMTALISVNLGVFNLLPIPGLDGFHIVFIIIELIRGGKKVPPNIQNIISTIGLVLLMLLAVLIMFSDIFKIVS